jgi:hypothetical protein
MFRTSRAVYGHMPKTGGTWLSQAMRPHGRDRLPMGHAPVRDVWEEHKGSRLLAGTVRDPWSWYASWYEHAKHNDPYCTVLSEWGGGSVEWADVLWGVTHGRVPRKGQRAGAIWRAEGSDPSMLEHMGLWSWAVRWFYGDAAGRLSVDHLLDNPGLVEGIKVLEGVDLSSAERTNHRETRSGAKYAFAKRKDYWSNPEWVEWVRAADGEMLKALGYTDPGVPSTLGPVIRLKADD